jgi:hypothetical protein
MRRTMLLLFLALLSAGCNNSQEPPLEPEQQQVLEEIEKLGGRFEYDETRPEFPRYKVDFSGVPVGDEVFGYLRFFPDLEVVDLANTRVTDEGVRNLISMQKLKQVRLHTTRVTREGVRVLREARPEVFIEY